MELRSIVRSENLIAVKAKAKSLHASRLFVEVSQLVFLVSYNHFLGVCET